jgi:hypothetical protein
MPILKAMRDIMLEKMETFITYFWVILQIHFFSSKTKRKKLYSEEIQKRKSLWVEDAGAPRKWPKIGWGG